MTDLQLEILSIKLPEYAELRSPAYRLVAVYTKANIQFVPGQNLYPTKTMITNIVKEWNSAARVVNGKIKGFKSKKEILVSKLDKLYNVMYCHCTNITPVRRRAMTLKDW